MIARLTYNPGSVIAQDEGSILIRLDYDDENYAPACQIYTSTANGAEDFEQGIRRSRMIYIGAHGGVGRKPKVQGPYRCPYTIDMFEDLEQAA